MPTDVTQLLNAAESGDAQAAEELLPLVYDELRKLAAAKMAREHRDQTLQATALVHEAWLRTVSRPPTKEELTRGVHHVASAGSVVEGMRDLMWALLNTKEFILIK